MDQALPPAGQRHELKYFFAKEKGRPGRCSVVRTEWQGRYEYPKKQGEWECRDQTRNGSKCYAQLSSSAARKHQELSRIPGKGQGSRRISHASLLEVIRRSLSENPGRTRGLHQFQLSLACCLKDTCQRRGSKSSRHRPRTKNTPKSHVLKPPKLRLASVKGRLLAKNPRWKMAA